MPRHRAHWLQLLLGFGVSAVAYHGWRESIEPMPTALEHVTGVVTGVEEVRAGRARTIHFHLEGSGREFAYPSFLPFYQASKAAIKPGSMVTVGYVGQNEPELWELSVDGESIVRSTQAYEARSVNGEWAFAIFLTSLLITAYLGWRSRRS